MEENSGREFVEESDHEMGLQGDGEYEEMQIEPKQKRFHNPINSPWLLITIPLLVVGIWLANHPEVITGNINKPYALLAAPVAVGTLLVGWIVFKFFTTIVFWCKSAYGAILRGRKEDGSAQFFWTVIAVFLVVSVFSSGSFFSILEHNAFPGLGYVTALFIDLIAVQAMRARLNAHRMRDKAGQRLYLFGVLLCAGASAFANVYTSLSDFHATVTGALPLWMAQVAPWFGLVFPALILLLSVTADYTIDQTSTKLDPNSYETHEKKRLRMLEIQRDMLMKRVSIEQEIDEYSAQLKINSREFFLVHWLFPQKQNVTSMMVEHVKTEFTPWFQHLDEKMQQMVVSSVHENSNQIMQVQREIQQLSFEMNAMIEMVANQSSVSSDAKLPVDDLVQPIETTEVIFPPSDETENETNSTLLDEVKDYLHHQERETDSLPLSRLDSNQYNEMTPTKKTTQTQVNAETKIETNNGRGEARQKALRILRRSPHMTPAELAKKADITPQYASKIMKQLV